MSLCRDCSKRHLCHSLCPEAEVFVNQDNVSISETLLPAADIDTLNKKAKFDVYEKEKQKILEKFYKMPKKQQVATLLEAGLSRAQIVQIVGITRENLRKTINKLKKDETFLTKVGE